MPQSRTNQTATERRALSSELSIALSFPLMLMILVWLAVSLSSPGSQIEPAAKTPAAASEAPQASHS